MNTKPQSRFTIEQVRLLAVILTVLNLALLLCASISKPKIDVFTPSSDPLETLFAIFCGLLMTLAAVLTLTMPFINSRGVRVAAVIIGTVIWSHFGLFLLYSSHEHRTLVPLRLISGVWLLGSTAGFVYLLKCIRITPSRFPSDADRCRHCGYSTTGLASSFCPECGARWNPNP